MDKKYIEWKIRKLKRHLAETDYQAIKYAEGEITLAEYSTVKTQRKLWRSEINSLEEELKAVQE